MFSKKEENHIKLRKECIKLLRKTEDRIITMEDVFSEALKIHEKTVWCTAVFDSILNILANEPLLQRIDLEIPYDRPLAIYPGHHKLQKTSFFILTEDFSEDILNMAKGKLKAMTDKALEAIKKKSAAKTKSPKPRETDPIPPLDLGIRFYGPTSMEQNGLVRPTYLKLQMIHNYLYTTFGMRKFTIDEAFDMMPIDLAIRTLKIKTVPKVIEEEPLLRFIPMMYIPDSMSEEIDKKTQKEALQALIVKILSKEKGNRIALIKKKGKKYRLYQRFRFVFPFSDTPYSITIVNRDSIKQLWCMIEFMMDIESTTTVSSEFIRKKFDYYKSSQSMSKYIKEKVARVRSKFRSYKELEGILRSVGDDFHFLTSLLSYKKKDNSYDWKLNDLHHVTPKDIAFNSFLPKVNYIIACNNVTTSGLIHKFSIDWESIRNDYFPDVEDFFKRIDKKIHSYYVSAPSKYFSSFNFNMACISSECCLERIGEPAFVSQSEYLERMGEYGVTMLLDSRISQAAEILKVISLSMFSTYKMETASVLLNEITEDTFKEALSFLQFKKFLKNEEAPSGITLSPTSLFFKRIHPLKTIRFYRSVLKAHAHGDTTSVQHAIILTPRIGFKFEFDSFDEKNVNFLLSVENKKYLVASDYTQAIQKSYIVVPYKVFVPYPSLPSFNLDFPPPEVTLARDTLANVDERMISRYFDVEAQLNVVMYQEGFTSTKTLMMVKMIYMFVHNSGPAGISLLSLPNYEESSEYLEILLHNNFIYIIPSTSPIPRFISSIYISEYSIRQNRVIKKAVWAFDKSVHVWIQSNGKYNSLILKSLLVKVAEYIAMHDSIEYEDIYKELTFLSYNDLNYLLLILESEGIIFSTTYKLIEGDILTPEEEIPCEEVSMFNIQAEIYLSFTRLARRKILKRYRAISDYDVYLSILLSSIYN